MSGFPNIQSNAAGAIPVYIASGGGSGSTSSVTTTLYTVLTEFTDGSNTAEVGDTLQNIQVISSGGEITSSIWQDLTQGFILTSAPNNDNIAVESSNPLTDAQLRAAPVAVTATQLPSTLGPKTSESSLSVYVANQSTSSNFPITNQYTATAAGTGYAIGDIIQQIQSFNFATNPATLVSTVWENLTQNTVLTTDPNSADLSLLSGSGLTNAQLRATPVAMSATQLPATLGAKTSALSTSVVLASDQAAIPVSGTLTVNAASSNMALESGGNLEDIYSIEKNLDLTGVATSATPFYASIIGKGTVTFSATGTWSGDVVIDGTVDGTNWNSLTFTEVSTGDIKSSFSAPVIGQVNAVGINGIRFKSGTIASGTVSIALVASRLVSNIIIDNPLPTGDNTIGFVGLNAGTESIGTVGLNAGTNAIGAITNTAFAINGTLPAFAATPTVNLGTLNGAALDASVNSLLKPSSTLSAVTSVGSIASTVTVKADSTINQTSPFIVDGSAVTQPVSVATLPLPTGAATSSLQSAGNTALTNINTTLGTPMQQTGGSVAVIGGNTTAVKVDGSAVTQPVSATALPLPTGASTSANQTNVQSTPGTAQTVALTVQGNDSGIAIPVKVASYTLPSAIYSAQKVTTTSASALTAQALVNGVILTSSTSNTGTIYVGKSTLTNANGYALVAGQSIAYAVDNTSAIYILGTNTTDVLYITGN